MLMFNRFDKFKLKTKSKKTKQPIDSVGYGQFVDNLTERILNTNRLG